MLYIVDTNVLLDFPQIVEDKEHKIIIPTSVLQELDALKKHVNQDTSSNARRAAIYVSRNVDTLNWYNCDRFGKLPVDDQVMEVAKETDGIVVTNDVYLKVKCIINKVQTKGYSPKDDYSGIEYWYIDSINDAAAQEQYAKLLENHIIPSGIILYENQYLIVEDINTKQTLGTFVMKNGEVAETKGRRIKNNWIDCIFPKNAEQACLFDALNDNSNTIIYAGGKYGTGY